MKALTARIAPAAALTALIGLAYAHSFSGPFVFDDRTVVAENPSIRSLAHLGRVFSPPLVAGTGGRPLANLTFALNYAISGTHVWSYHLFNVALHVVAAVLLLAWLRLTLDRPVVPEGLRRRAAALAFCIAAVWALHPVHTSVATYISQRTESLMGCCYLLTLWAFTRAARSEGRGRGWWILSVVGCAAGMGCKEVMATAPIAVWWYDAVFYAGSPWAALRRRPFYYGALALTWAALAAFMVTSHPHERGVGDGLGVTPGIYLLTETRAILTYFKLCFWPHPLIFDYGPVFVRHLQFAALPGSIVLVLLLATGLLAWRAPAAGFAAVWFFLLLAPTSSFVPVFHQPVAENRLYLSSIGLLALAILALVRVAGRAGFAAIAAILVAEFGLTVLRNRDYRSDRAIWTSVVAHNSINSRAIFNLGCAEYNEGDVDGAIQRYRQALAISPNYEDVYQKLGIAWEKLGRLGDALAAFQRAVALGPRDAPYRTDLGRVMKMTGHLPQAIDEFAAAVQLNPNHAAVHYNLADALLVAGRLDEAKEQAQEALRLDPDMAEAHNDLGCVYFDQGKLPEAADQLQAALAIRPDYPEALNNLGNVLLQRGDSGAAADRYRTAIALRPGYAEAYSNLGAALSNLGQLNAALEAFGQALRLNPRQPVAHYDAGNILLHLGRTEEAVAQFKTALSLAPGLAPAREALRRLHRE